MELTLPNRWIARPHQIPLWQEMEEGCKRAVAVWHRRAGKDSVSLNWTSVASHIRTGVYWHMLPTATQGRKVIWDGIARDGQRMIDQAFPPALRKNINNTEMKIELKSGSIWQVVGSDNYDRLVGANPVGVVCSEYSIADPRAWDYLRPILAENGGWIIFIYTARGPNHGKRIYDIARGNPNWFCEKLTVDDTTVLGPEVIQEERDSGMEEEMIQQEYYCSFDAPLAGSYYGKTIVQMEQEKPRHFTRIPHDPSHNVQTWWDLGINDQTCICFTQYIAGEWRFIDYKEDSNKSIGEWAEILREKPYTYDFHGGPHDVEESSLQTGTDLKSIAAGYGIEFVTIPRTRDLRTAIQTTRANLRRAWIDTKNCERLIDCLKNYAREWDEKNKVFINRPVHNWASHGADSFRTWSEGHTYYTGLSDMSKYPTLASAGWSEFEDPNFASVREQQFYADQEYDPLNYMH